VYTRPKDYWSEFEPDLRQAFNGLYGYCAMIVAPLIAVAVENDRANGKDWRN
jgi:hypothetical protein